MVKSSQNWLGFYWQRLTLYQRERFSDWSKFKVLADDKINVAEMIIPLPDRTENIVGKGENAGYQHFLLFPQFFQKLPFSRSLKVGIVW